MIKICEKENQLLINKETFDKLTCFFIGVVFIPYVLVGIYPYLELATRVSKKIYNDDLSETSFNEQYFLLGLLVGILLSMIWIIVSSVSTIGVIYILMYVGICFVYLLICLIIYIDCKSNGDKM